MTKKYEDFMEELQALCEKHQVFFDCSGYDTMQVWDKYPDIVSPAIPPVYDLIQDRTLS